MTHTVTFDYTPAGIVPWCHTCHQRLDDPVDEHEAAESARLHRVVDVPRIEGSLVTCPQCARDVRRLTRNLCGACYHRVRRAERRAERIGATA